VAYLLSSPQTDGMARKTGYTTKGEMAAIQEGSGTHF